MTGNQDKIDELLHKLGVILRKQQEFSTEIKTLKDEILRLKKEGFQQEKTIFIPEEKVERAVDAKSSEFPLHEELKPALVKEKEASSLKWFEKLGSPKVKSNLEKFIGENLISTIGIVITVIGVAIGAKYSIEHELISPLTRIVLGYLAGLGLLGLGLKFKQKYKNYSAILVSGAMAIMYFITYAAYDFYGLIPQMLSFALMVFFTGFTVLASIHYNRQVIAHIGLVGAYGVPFLLSNGSGNAAMLFSYMAIINLGILAIAFKKYWKPLNWVSFALTWMVFLAWYTTEYKPVYFVVGLCFSAVFFGIFYMSALVFKLIRKEIYVLSDVQLLLINAFVFYGTGYGILADHGIGSQLLGLFTLGNALVHFMVSLLIYKKKLADKSMLYLIAGLVLVFGTMAIPVQLDGNWVTLLWTGEAVLLFWIGKTKQIAIYEKISYPLMVLAFGSLVHDWHYGYRFYYFDSQLVMIKPLLNANFLTSVLFIAGFAMIVYKGGKYKSSGNPEGTVGLWEPLKYLAPVIFLFSLYYAFRVEIENYWNQLYENSMVTINKGNNETPAYLSNRILLELKAVWVINYSLFFLMILGFTNLKKIQHSLLGWTCIILNTLALTVFLTQGLHLLSSIRLSYLDPNQGLFEKQVFPVVIRYVSYLLVAGILWINYRYSLKEWFDAKFKIALELISHITILWILSSELINWLDWYNEAQSYKLGLSILWGAFALWLIVLGLWKQKKFLRIGAIVLFGITLVKLFFYDISHLGTIAKTIVFVSLGTLLLIVSFLYNKYKNIVDHEVGK